MTTLKFSAPTVTAITCYNYVKPFRTILTLVDPDSKTVEPPNKGHLGDINSESAVLSFVERLSSCRRSSMYGSYREGNNGLVHQVVSRVERCNNVIHCFLSRRVLYYCILPPSDPSTSSSSDNTLAILISGVVVSFIIATSVTIVIAIVLILKSQQRRTEFNPNER